jgi:hypothetical protein
MFFCALLNGFIVCKGGRRPELHFAAIQDRIMSASDVLSFSILSWLSYLPQSMLSSHSQMNLI